MTHDAPARAFRLGTRGSALARAQADLVAQRLLDAHPALHVELIIVRTEGDTDKASPLTVIGGRGVFTSALQDALLNHEIDAAVHSAKDLPSAESEALRVAAFLAREDPRDVLVSRHRTTLAELPPSPVIGTSSRRRATQVRHARPDAQIVELRGNVDTRIKKALEGELDGIVIAAAGLIRMGWVKAVSEYLPLDHFVPAPGQGALAVEVRVDDQAGELVNALADPIYALPVRVERAFLRAIGAGCTTPIGAHASIGPDGVHLRCMLASDDGSRAEWRSVVLAAGEAENAAAQLSKELLASINSSPETPLPLGGRSVLITRPRQDVGELARQIEVAGGEALLAPAIRIEPAPFDPASIAKQLEADPWDWIVFTSYNAVENLLVGLAGHASVCHLLERTKLAAVGDATTAALRDHGLDVDFTGAGGTARLLGEELAATGIRGQRVLLPQGNLNRSDLASILQEHGAVVETIQVYTTSGETSLPENILKQLDSGRVDAITFTSPSSVREFMRLLGAGPEQLAGVLVACIGPTTAEEARRLGLDQCVVAERPGIEELVASLVDGLHGADVRPRQGAVA